MTSDPLWTFACAFYGRPGVAAACPDRPPFVLAQRGHLIREAGLLPGAACLTLPRYKGDLR